MMTRPNRSIVLSGGGARGAYEAGVLNYIFTQLPAALLEKNRIKIVCGTSVGAIHACFLAAWAHRTDHNIGDLLEVWRAFRLDKLLRLGTWDIMRLPLDVRRLFSQKNAEQGIFLNAAVLHKIVSDDIPWQHMHNNLNQGRIDGVTVSATHIASGKTVVFIDRPDGVPSWTRDHRRVARATRIGPMHALASAAIPLLFSAIRIDGAYYCDGGLRQNTPLSPALRLGADRVLVIPVGHGKDNSGPQKVTTTAPTVDPDIGTDEAYPGPSLLLGKVLNALLLDHLDYDLAQLRGFNRLLEDGTRTFGESFLDELSKTTQKFRGAGYRNVDTVVVRPSADLGVAAAQFLDSGVLDRDLRPMARWLLHYMTADADGPGGRQSNSDLVSYLLFDGRLSQTLIDLGMADADACRAALIDFFTD
jgi:NTE family protein